MFESISEVSGAIKDAWSSVYIVGHEKEGPPTTQVNPEPNLDQIGPSWLDVLHTTLEPVVAVDRYALHVVRVPRRGP